MKHISRTKQTQCALQCFKLLKNKKTSEGSFVNSVHASLQNSSLFSHVNICICIGLQA